MKDNVIVKKLIIYVDKIDRYCAGKNYDSFIVNTQLVEACVFNLSQMGELVNKLDDQFVAEHTQIPWHQLRGLRNRIVHDYEGVNLMLVWDVIKLDLPGLKRQLESLLENLNVI